MFTKQTAIEEVKKFLIECQRLPLTIDRAILFGSVAQDKANENSDIDLALFSDNFGDNILNNLDLIGSVNIRFPDIDVHTYSSSSYKQEGLMIEQIIKTVIEIKISA